MVTKDGWLLRPALRGMCKAESLMDDDGPFDLYDVWLLNEALNVDDENRRRIEKAATDAK